MLKKKRFDINYLGMYSKLKSDSNYLSYRW